MKKKEPPKKVKKLKLFVWENVLEDHTCGIMFALAKDIEDVRKQILKNGKESSVVRDLKGEPLVITKPTGFAVWDGG